MLKKVRRLEIQPKVIGHEVNYYFRECHNHNFYEFMIIAKGKSVHHVNDDVQILSEGDLIFVRPDDVHYIMPYTDTSDKYEFYNIHVSVEDMQREYASCTGIQEVIEGGVLPPIVRLSTWENGFFLNKFKCLNRMTFGEKRDYLYYSLLKDVCNQMLNNRQEQQITLPDWLKVILENMDVKNPSTLMYENIIKDANVSKSYLWKTFKRYLDSTPTDYINNLKLEYAYELIVTTNMSLLDISMTTGFNNYNHFHRLFTKKYSVTPNKVRERG